MSERKIVSPSDACTEVDRFLLLYTLVGDVTRPREKGVEPALTRRSGRSLGSAVNMY